MCSACAVVPQSDATIRQAASGAALTSNGTKSGSRTIIRSPVKMAASTMNLTLQQSLVGKFAKRQPFRSATRAPLRLVRAEDPISPDEGPVSKEIISCKPPSMACCHQGYLHAMEGAFNRRALTSIEHLHPLMQMQRLCRESRTHSQVSASGVWHTSTIAP